MRQLELAQAADYLDWTPWCSPGPVPVPDPPKGRWRKSGGLWTVEIARGAPDKTVLVRRADGEVRRVKLDRRVGADRWTVQ